MKTQEFKPLVLPQLIQAASQLPMTGTVAAIELYTYLDIDDRFIHELYPLLPNPHKLIQKPNYFGENMGAHISIIYPEENQLIHDEDIGTKHTFTIQQAFTTTLDMKKYWGLAIHSPSILALRKKYDLAERPCYKNHRVNFHITIGVL
jgi:hypothetical protein